MSRYREPGSNRHAHHWAKDFKSFLSTYSNIAACFQVFRSKAGAKVLLFFDIRKNLRFFLVFFYLDTLFIGSNDAFDKRMSDDIFLVEGDDRDAFDILKPLHGILQSGLLRRG